MGWVDLVLLCVVLLSVAVGLWRGLVFELMALAGWAIAYLAAPFVSPFVEPVLPRERLGEGLAHALALVLAFVLVLLLWSLVAKLLRALIQASPLSLLDRLGGAGFGALRALFIALLATVLVGMTPLVQNEAWQSSAAVPWLEALLHGLRPMLPEAVNKFIQA